MVSFICRSRKANLWLVAGLAAATAWVGSRAHAATLADNAHHSDPTHAFFLGQSQSFLDSAQQLQRVLKRECTAENLPSELPESGPFPAAKPIQYQVSELMLDWMPLQGVVSGPPRAQERYWQVQFWPDKKNTTGRQLSALLKQNYEWELAWLTEQSVAVQGLGALEWLWFDEQAQSWSWAQRCQVSQVVAANVTQNADAIVEAWQSNPWQDLSGTQWKAEALALMVDQLDRVMKKLSLPLGKNVKKGKNGKAKPFFAEAWRSHTSLALIKANLTQLEAQFSLPHSGVRALLLEQKQSVLAERIDAQFEQILRDWPSEPSLVKALESQQGHRAMIQRYNQIERLHYLLSEPTANALGVLVGFNSTDGD